MTFLYRLLILIRNALVICEAGCLLARDASDHKLADEELRVGDERLQTRWILHLELLLVIRWATVVEDVVVAVSFRKRLMRLKIDTEVKSFLLVAEGMGEKLSSSLRVHD